MAGFRPPHMPPHDQGRVVLVVPHAHQRLVLGLVNEIVHSCVHFCVRAYVQMYVNGVYVCMITRACGCGCMCACVARSVCVSVCVCVRYVRFVGECGRNLPMTGAE